MPRYIKVSGYNMESGDGKCFHWGLSSFFPTQGKWKGQCVIADLYAEGTFIHETSFKPGTT